MRFEKTIKLYMTKEEIEIIDNFLTWLGGLEDEEYGIISELTNDSDLFDAVNELYTIAEEDPSA